MIIRIVKKRKNSQKGDEKNNTIDKAAKEILPEFYYDRLNVL